MNPYAKHLGDRDPLAALVETSERVRELVGRMSDDELEQPYGPGKWTAAQILDHMTQTEMVFGMRLRMALTTPGYVVQPFDQDRFVAREPRKRGRDAFEAYYAQRKYNLPLYRSLTEDERKLTFMHPERGQLTAGDLPAWLAGHELHHLEHLEQIAGRRPDGSPPPGWPEEPSRS